MTEPTSSPTSEEAKRQAIILLFGLVGTVATAYVLYYFASPDAWKTLKMRLALKAKRLTQSQADWWQTLADKAATMYNQERP